MDEWVPLSRIDVQRGVVEETPKESDYLDCVNGRERKVTRNLKRKHDEINHVQKVRRERGLDGGLVGCCREWRENIYMYIHVHVG